ncbi:MAG: hypothetical protein ACE5EC_01480 [Phycisphaerae bacterium]
MSESTAAARNSRNQGTSGAQANPSPAKRGRPAKEPPPPKLWRVVGESPEGVKVTLGRYVSREEAEPELVRMREDGFYEKLRMIDGARVTGNSPTVEAAAG